MPGWCSVAGEHYLAGACCVWGRTDRRRGQTWLGLDASLRALGSRLAVLHGEPAQALPALARRLGADTVVCERIAAPEEDAEVAALRAAGLTVREHWQSGLFEPSARCLPWPTCPSVFSQFLPATQPRRLSVAGRHCPRSASCHPWPARCAGAARPQRSTLPAAGVGLRVSASCWPGGWTKRPGWRIWPAIALVRTSPDTKATRNGLSGTGVFQQVFALAPAGLVGASGWAALARATRNMASARARSGCALNYCGGNTSGWCTWPAVGNCMASGLEPAGACTASSPGQLCPLVEGRTGCAPGGRRHARAGCQRLFVQPLAPGGGQLPCTNSTTTTSWRGVV